MICSIRNISIFVVINSSYLIFQLALYSIDSSERAEYEVFYKN